MTDAERPWLPLLNEAGRLEDGPARLALFEEAVRLADLHADDAASFELRQRMFWSAIVSGQADKMLVAFAWCLAMADRQPERFPERQLFWRYCYSVPGVMRTFPQFGRSQIEGVFDDLYAHLRRSGRGIRAVVGQQALTCLYLGDLDRAADLWERQAREQIDPELHDPMIAQKEVAHYHLIRGDEPAALDGAEPLFAGRVPGRPPHLMFAHLLPLLVRAGRVAEAVHWHRVGYPVLAAQILALGEIGKHVEFLALTGNLDLGVTLLERHAPWLPVTHEVIDRYNFLLGCRFLLERLREERGPSARLRLPADFPGHRPDGDYVLDAVVAAVDAAACELAARYDARAGNDWFGRTTTAFSRSLHGSIVRHPLPARTDKNAKH
jgi:hypothetical protein